MTNKEKFVYKVALYNWEFLSINTLLTLPEGNIHSFPLTVNADFLMIWNPRLMKRVSNAFEFIDELIKMVNENIFRLCSLKIRIYKNIWKSNMYFLIGSTRKQARTFAMKARMLLCVTKLHRVYPFWEVITSMNGRSFFITLTNKSFFWLIET